MAVERLGQVREFASNQNSRSVAVPVHRDIPFDLRVRIRPPLLNNTRAGGAGQIGTCPPRGLCEELRIVVSITTFLEGMSKCPTKYGEQRLIPKRHLTGSVRSSKSSGTRSIVLFLGSSARRKQKRSSKLWRLIRRASRLRQTPISKRSSG